MSDAAPQLDIREQIVRIDRNIAETQKLLAEGRKFNRERWIVPVTVLGAIIAAVVARLPEILHALGVGR
jgi:preprotein translocase subunit SecY